MQVGHILFCILFINQYLFSLDISSSLKEELVTPKKVRILLGLDDLSSRNKKLESLKNDLIFSEELYKKNQLIIHHKIDEIKIQIQDLELLSASKNNALIHKKIHILQKILNAYNSILELQDKVLETININIEFWEKYFRDVAVQSDNITEKSLYSFADFSALNVKMFIQKDLLNQIYTQKEALSILMNREAQLLIVKDHEIVRINELIQEKKKLGDINKEDMHMCDLEKELIAKEREISSLKCNIYQRELDYLSVQEIVAHEKQVALNQNIKTMRSRLYVDMSDVDFYVAKYHEEQEKNQLQAAELLKQRHDCIQKKMYAQQELDRLRAKYKLKIQGFKNIESFEFSAHSNAENFGFASVALAYITVVGYERILNLIKAQMHSGQTSDELASIIQNVVKLLHDISQGKSKDSQTFQKEQQSYQKIEQTLQQDLKNSKDELIALQSNIETLQQLLTHLLSQQEKIKNNMSMHSASLQKKASENIILIEQSVKQLEQQYETLTNTLQLYEKIIDQQEKSLQNVQLFLEEMQFLGVWHRSMSAVTWEGIKNIIPNMVVFMHGMRDIIFAYFSTSTIQVLIHTIKTHGISGVLFMLFTIFIMVLSFFTLRALLPGIYKSLLQIEHDETDTLYKLRQLLAVTVGFLIDVFKPLYIWFICLLYEFFTQAPVGFLIFFYMYSIIFWIYASRRLLIHFLAVNRKFDYGLLVKRLIERFSHVYLFFATSTIIILILRKMLIVVMADQQTELPNILLRLYHIAIFIAMVFSLDKEELLHVLPKKTSLQQKLCYVLDRYYYSFLGIFFLLLVLSDPYLGGYGIVIWRFGWNMFLTSLILVGIYILYTLIKKHSNFLFFVHCPTAGGVTERFDYAKTWYAIYIIWLMLCSLMVSFICIAYVWGYPITLHMLRKIMTYELFKIETINSLGKATPESFKLFNLFYILFMTAIGIILAYAFKKLVLERVFDIQYVDPGIQNTIIIISRYVIIVIAVMIACIQSKLGFVVTYVSFVGLATFGWSFKDLFTDFVAYFFILVQRPLKLGDYVRINEETMGVVRKIGPRAVILRRKNAVNIVVPNSTVLKNALYNWNYVRSYIGFDDIIFCVPFGTDINVVKEICFKVLDADSDVLKVPQPFVRLQDFSDKGYVFMIRGFLSSGNTLRQWDITSNIRFTLVQELAKVGITIAGPTFKIMMKSDQELHRF